MEHYRCYKFHVPEIKGTRTAATEKLFPAHCKVSQISSKDAAIEVENYLINAISSSIPLLPNLQLENNHYNALKQLAPLFNNTQKNQENI